MEIIASRHLVMNRAACPRFHDAIELLGRRWNGVILRDLVGGPRRFSQISSSIPGMTDAMLSQRLKDLEAAGIVSRTVTATRPPEAHYELTEVGNALVPVLDAVANWSIIWADAQASAQAS